MKFFIISVESTGINRVLGEGGSRVWAQLDELRRGHLVVDVDIDGLKVIFEGFMTESQTPELINNRIPRRERKAWGRVEFTALPP